MSNMCDSSSNEKVEQDSSIIQEDETSKSSTTHCDDSKSTTIEIDDSKSPTNEIDDSRSPKNETDDSKSTTNVIDDSKSPTVEIDIPKSPALHHDSSPGGSGVSGDNEKSGDTSDFDDKTPKTGKAAEKVLGKTYFCFKLHRYHHDTRYFMTFIVLLFILF